MYKVGDRFKVIDPLLKSAGYTEAVITEGPNELLEYRLEFLLHGRTSAAVADWSETGIIRCLRPLEVKPKIKRNLPDWF